MQLTEQEAAAIRMSWASAKSASDVAGDLFYGRLFQIAPEARPLFGDNIAQQAQKLMNTLDVVVDGLEGDLAPTFRELGRRHEGYGALPVHYDKVGEALIWTLEELLGAAFSDEARSAWNRAYGEIAAEMIGASGAPDQAAG